MSGNEKVILIKGNQSKWYEQAIFIVKESVLTESGPIDFVAEAEKIIVSYLDKAKLKLAEEKKSMDVQKNSAKAAQASQAYQSKLPAAAPGSACVSNVYTSNLSVSPKVGSKSVPRVDKASLAKKKKSFDTFLNLVMLTCCLIIVGIMFWGMR